MDIVPNICIMHVSKFLRKLFFLIKLQLHTAFLKLSINFFFFVFGFFMILCFLELHYFNATQTMRQYVTNYAISKIYFQFLNWTLFFCVCCKSCLKNSGIIFIVIVYLMQYNCTMQSI